MTFNWFDEHYYIPMPLWMAVIITVLFILVVCAIGGSVLAKNTYACPNCGHLFKKKWYQMMLSLHINDNRWLKCPSCKKKDWCSKKD